ncbi:beta-1,3-galactosyltransferase 1-like [Panulirus ornatus]|uniref:beta-1,3-galactosyltransferase 1-like n=1 Tax=Panulirus ornatus TaxID=150431 RepID=UPI003A880C96
MALLPARVSLFQANVALFEARVALLPAGVALLPSSKIAWHLPACLALFPTDAALLPTMTALLPDRNGMVTRRDNDPSETSSYALKETRHQGEEQKKKSYRNARRRLLLAVLQLAVVLAPVYYLDPSLVRWEHEDPAQGRGLRLGADDDQDEDVSGGVMAGSRGVHGGPVSNNDPANTLEPRDDAEQDDDDEKEPSTFIPDQPDTSPLRHPADIPKRFLIEEADFCQKRPGLQVIAYVHSSIMRVKQRNETRATWANASAYDMGHMSVHVGAVFMVGRAKNDVERQIVQEESQRYHDIVQGDYGDHYRLLSYKGLSAFYWINLHCPHVPWTLHADDDTHIDIFLYYKALQELNDKAKEQFVCSHMYGPALRWGRWKVRRKEYPARDYPLYCSGGAWFLQTKLIPRLLKASKVVPFLWVDDAYITGLLAKEAGIKHFAFQKYYGGPKVKPELLGRQVAWFVKFAPRRVWWDMIVSHHRRCSLHNPVTLISPKKSPV